MQPVSQKMPSQSSHAKVLSNGTPAAFVTPEHSWVLGTVTGHDDRTDTYTCSAKDPEPVTIDRIPNDTDHLWLPRPESLEEDVDDLLQLTELHEASLLFCLKRRYMRDVVYTNIGPIVVAINPFNYDIPWYKEEKMADYLTEGTVVEHNLPHSWAVAHNTYWEMMENHCNQTILISGESGAGKTEAAKIVMKYLGALSTRHGNEAQMNVCAEVNKRVLAASPILETFGNAKTVRNDNSSRFGKFATIQFDRDGFLVGCFITKYLLEKSRIITAATNERVYHSFYQLAQSATGKEYGIRNPKIYRVLNAGGTLAVDGVDDAAEFGVTRQAMIDVGILEDEQTAIWRVVAGVLFLQNVDFTEAEDRGSRVAKLDPNLLPVLSRVCELWDIAEEEFKKELVSSLIVTKREQMVKLLSKAAAQDTRDSVSKSMYNWLFDWLVTKMNSTTDRGDSTQHWIGLLDIFGFENFHKNSFEQLCINLANETLQGHYNAHVFTQDMKECREEGIDTTEVQFVDNKGCIDLLTGRVGVFTLLDEECAVSGSEKNYLAKLVDTFSKKPDSTTDVQQYFFPATGKAMDNHFRIRHYAAVVQYCVDNFLDKNRDALKETMRTLLAASKTPLIAALVPAPADTGNRSSAKLTVGATFVKQLNELMSVINSTSPHWIRCIKPHASKQPRQFAHKLVMAQLRSAGVLDTITVRKAGYPIRLKIDVFVVRYRVLFDSAHAGNAPRKRAALEGDAARQALRDLFSRLAIDKSIGQLGTTKVFLRQAAFLRLNHAKDDAVLKFSMLLQAVGRGNVSRASTFAAYVAKNRQRILEEKRRREEEERLRRKLEEERLRAEQQERERREKMERELRYTAAVTIQKHVRGQRERRIFSAYYIDLLRAKEEHMRDDELIAQRNFVTTTDKRLRMLTVRNAEMEKLRAHGVTKMADTDRRRQKLREQREHTREHCAEKQRRVDGQVAKELELECIRRRRSEAAMKAEMRASYEAQRQMERQRCVSTRTAAQSQSELRFQAELEAQLAWCTRDGERAHRNPLYANDREWREKDPHEKAQHIDEKYVEGARVREQRSRDQMMRASTFSVAQLEWIKQERWCDQREQVLTADMSSHQRSSGVEGNDRTYPRHAPFNEGRHAGDSFSPIRALKPSQRRLEEQYRVHTVDRALKLVEESRVLQHVRQNQTL